MASRRVLIQSLPERGRVRVTLVRPVLSAVNRARPPDEADDHKEERAQAVQAQVGRLPAE